MKAHLFCAFSILRGKMKVTLTNSFDNSYNNAIACAYSCYSPKIVTEEVVEKNPERRDSVADSTFKANHFTVYQHAHFQFAIEGVSRQCIWSFLHNQKFYNSEQQSQRYVKMKREKVYTPPFVGNLDYDKFVNHIFSIYEELSKLLYPIASEKYYSIFKARKKHDNIYSKTIEKKCIESARAILPTAMLSHLYHTVNLTTLHRLRMEAHKSQTPDESIPLIKEMCRLVEERHPGIFRIQYEDQNPIYSETDYSRALFAVFEPESKIVNFLPISEEQLVFIAKNYDPSILSDDVYNSVMLDEDLLSTTGQLKNLVQYTFEKSTTHYTDSQEQRHRELAQVRGNVRENARYSIPKIIQESTEATNKFREGIDVIRQFIFEANRYDENKKYTQYLLPNAVEVNTLTSGNLFGYLNKWKMRLCLNAQEEAFDIAMQEIEQVKKIHPNLGQWIGAPCHIRKWKGIKPICPEGDRFCGVPVWKEDITKVTRLL